MIWKYLLASLWLLIFVGAFIVLIGEIDVELRELLIIKTFALLVLFGEMSVLKYAQKNDF